MDDFIQRTEGDFFERALAAFRRGLRAEPAANDEDAMMRIVDLVFRDEAAARYSVQELDGMIRKLFYKTRCRLGILQPLMEDPSVTEIMVNGPQDIFIERGGKLERCPMTFDSLEELEDIMRNIAAQVHREINEMQPIVDARLEDGSRVNGVYRNVAVNGPILTIRKFSENFLTLKSLTGSGTVTETGAQLLACLVECGYNIFVSGGTSSGKTTLLNALSEHIPAGERVIVIEDSSELKLTCVENIVHLECRNSNAAGKGQVTMSQLLKSSLRMRPDRIIVGEVRGSEVLDMLQALNTGHSGMSTGHGNSVEGMLRRLETMYMMAMPLHIDAVRAQIAEALDIMVHVEKLEGGRRRVVEITEIEGFENGKFLLNPLLKRQDGGNLLPTGNSLKHSRKVVWKGEAHVQKLRDLGFLPAGSGRSAGCIAVGRDCDRMAVL